MSFIRGRYSWLIRPTLIVYDIFVLNILAYYLLYLNEAKLYFFSVEFFNNKQLLYFIYSGLFWIMSALMTNFYKIYRYTNALSTIANLFKQFLLYSIIVYAFIGIFRSVSLQATETLNYLIYCFVCIGSVKLLSYYALKFFRSYLKGNIRKIVVIGSNLNAQKLLQFFKHRKELGYNLQAVFSKDKNDGNKSIKDSFEYIKNHPDIDEIYCTIDELTENEVNTFVKLANLNKSNIKFIPEDAELLNKRLKTEYYSYLPVLSMPQVALNTDFNRFIKRGFDVVFSLLICVFVLSWLNVILFILIKLESKGPLFYVHKRTGINFKEYNCYKYRSLKTTKEVKGTYVSQDDHRLTKIGKFLRKTSLDELPQFYNVLKGDMSVVGPRPHMLTYTEAYSKIINKYNFFFRHNVKPGITGMAQVKGYRGEVKNDEDIINRIKYDIFYIDNWSLILDLDIILKTCIKILKGDDKAY